MARGQQPLEYKKTSGLLTVIKKEQEEEKSHVRVK